MIKRTKIYMVCSLLRSFRVLLQVRYGLNVPSKVHFGDLVFSVAMFGSDEELFSGGTYWTSSP